MTTALEKRVSSSWFALAALLAICGGALAFTMMRLPAAPHPASAQPPDQSIALAATNRQPHELPAVRVINPDPEYARIARLLAVRLPRLHLLHKPCDDSVATNALHLYLNSLDPDHTFFLSSDVERFRALATAMDDNLLEGDIKAAYDIFALFKERVRDRVQFIDTILAKGFDFTTTENYQWKRKGVEWAVDEQAWNAIWTSKVKNEYLAQLIARKLADESAATNAHVQAASAGPATNASAAETNIIQKSRSAPLPGASTNATTASIPASAGELTNGAAGTRRISDIQNAQLTPEQFIRKRYERFLTVLNDSDAEWVLQRYLTAFTQAYDPHSEYLSATSSEDFDISMKLSLGGVGAVLSSDDGAAKIERIIPGGPADRDGRLKPGDRIIAVGQGDGELVDIMHWPLYRAVRLIRGPKGTKVTLLVIPATDITGAVTVRFQLIRDEVKLEEQAAKGRVETVKTANGNLYTIGIINLPAFYVDLKKKFKDRDEYRSSGRDVAQLIVDMLQSNRIDGILLDLRNNGGGSLTEAVDMTGLFLRTGPVVQVNEMRNVQILSDMNPAILYGGPLAVLVNRQSASATEILSAALQDYGRAIIIGDSKTHGKGSVQSLVNLDYNNANMGQIKVTSATFHRIAGGSTQLEGVRPDIVLPSFLDVMEIGEEFLPHALPWSQVLPAYYRPVNDLSTLLPQLREMSTRRQKQDIRFKAYTTMLAKFAEQQTNNTITLNLARRLALARAEKDIADVEEKMEESDAPSTNAINDVVLPEAVRILADYITLSRTEPKP